MKYVKRILFWVIPAFLSYLLSCPVFASGNVAAEKLKQELLELEKITKPFVQTFQKISQLVSPSVVCLITEKKESPKAILEAVPSQPRQYFTPEKEHHPENVPKRGIGSGIIIDERGYILTNNHVVSGFSPHEITVVTYNGEQYANVDIVGVDPNTDIAVIKIEGKDFSPAEFGNPEDVQVGDWVVAIGNPFGYQQTVSVGIISAKGRTHVIPMVLPFVYEDFFQTDAAINPGNSGGPLVNFKGEVIGVNTAIATRSGGYQGVGFAISSSIAKETAENIIATGTVVRGYLGVGTHDINDELAVTLGLRNKKDVMSHFGLSSEKGVFVLEVWSDTPASKGGILPGDIIFELGGKRIENTTDLQHAIRRTKVDAKVIVKVVRYGAENTVEIIIERQPEDLSGRTYSAVRKSEEPVKFSLGLAVSDMNPEVAKSLGFEGEKGVLVIDVEEDSPAEHAGIKPGDLITKIGTKEIGTVMEFIDLLDTFLKQNGSVSIFVKNKGFLTLK